ncbi:hypothetical protein [Staphylococcus intermedius]|uniref:Uncharacterized protein n=1 Tax=Staphylococcus intermedius NCTC 11048 TaxID=1141106 RepID=A0A380G621_STAIN|nr:hypothetical protein [Staphylococcus intermedius]PCF63986.1 hypothetical protein B5C04_08395 [Staphylococcus intermedius]PCF78701.1 hypothetical protein B4W74_08745 [Staphylococcus intermedius]PCF79674.1 hypothetical protein B4W70_08385 [Staphylococcus intermedius]PCF85975.1 hypothetical protein B4W76_09550 [Staphylococcus intermedius]PNZ53551.1 hypothetical protein CD138_04350 [Staphylococcus intermedius NCTC 11048]
MKQSVNQIALYRKINSEITKEAQMHFSPLKICYENDDEIKTIDIDITEDKEILINEIDSMWSPYENELQIEQELIIGNPKALFGEKGVTCEDNTIGFAVHIHSKTSYYQKVKEIGSITFNDSEELKLIYKEKFDKDFLRGSINFDFFLYLKEVKKTKPYFANKIGMKLTVEDLNTFKIIVDGSGSIFPITEFSEKGGPLWKVNKSWIDASEDTFDSSNVSLMINNKHSLYHKVTSGKSDKMLTGSIVLQVISMIIDEVINKENQSIEDEEEIIEGTILAAVSYWVKTFEVQTQDIFTIQSSLFANMENEVTQE